MKERGFLKRAKILASAGALAATAACGSSSSAPKDYSTNRDDYRYVTSIPVEHLVAQIYSNGEPKKVIEANGSTTVTATDVFCFGSDINRTSHIKVVGEKVGCSKEHVEVWTYTAKDTNIGITTQ